MFLNLRCRTILLSIYTISSPFRSRLVHHRLTSLYHHSTSSMLKSTGPLSSLTLIRVGRGVLVHSYDIQLALSSLNLSRMSHYTCLFHKTTHWSPCLGLVEESIPCPNLKTYDILLLERREYVFVDIYFASIAESITQVSHVSTLSHAPD